MGKIAVIDSGLGGLTVVKEILKQLPHEDVIYFGDQKNCPYGDKTRSQIHHYIVNIVTFLERFDIKALVIACNTATAVVLEDLVDMCPYPVIGVIESGAQFALEKTKNKKIGLIATEKTIESGIYEETLTLFDASVEVYGKACPKIVPLLEKGTIQEEVLQPVLEEYLLPLKVEGIDTLILGCTHYPLVAGMIHEIMGGHIQLANPAIRTVSKLKDVLVEVEGNNPTDRMGSAQFFTSGSSRLFDRQATCILGIPVQSTPHDYSAAGEVAWSLKTLYVSRQKPRNGSDRL